MGNLCEDKSEHRLFDVKNKATKLFQDEGFLNPHLEVFSLLENITGLTKTEMVIDENRLLSLSEIEQLETLVNKRLSGYPLQYILKEWDFLGLTLSVGEGVLIPRPETELLCEAVYDFLKKLKQRTLYGGKSDRIKGIDLCSGSGCVALGLSYLWGSEKLPLSLDALELSPDAFHYLEENCRRYPEFSVNPMIGDIFTDHEKPEFSSGFDFIVSNPPYLRADEMETLDEWVEKEPETAFIGGEDGLEFYRAIAEKWIPKLKLGGICAVEVGLGQSKAVAEIFTNISGVHGEIKVLCDYSGIERIVSFENKV